MQTQKMTIHRALAELKLIDAKILKGIGEIQPSGIYQKEKKIGGYIDLTEFEKTAKAKLQSVTDLIDRKSKIKSAIVAANGITKVVIDSKEMTIADAINFKSVINFKRSLIDTLKANHRKTIVDLSRHNDLVAQNVQKLLEFTFGKDNVKADAKDIEAVRKPYVDANEAIMFDPLKVEEIVSNIEQEVSKFEIEVDAVLSEINATTLIEV